MKKIDLNNKKEIWYDLFKTSLSGVSREKDIWTEKVIERAIDIADKGLEGFLKKFQTKNEVLPFVPKLKTNGYNAVDLGLPSGTLWCDRNVGAKSPEDYGLYFAWGETEGYVGVTEDKSFCETDYKWLRNDKYSNKEMLDLEDDAAYVNMGGDWHMPSSAQINELIDNTIPTVETIGTVKGMRYISKNGTSKSIFVPFAGYCGNGGRDCVGDFGYYWSSSRFSDVNYGYYLSCNDNGSAWLSRDGRCYGFSVRGVLG